MASGITKPYLPSDKDLLHKALEIKTKIKNGIPRGTDKKLNILVVGLPGCGKSSLINSLMTSIDKEGPKDRLKTGLVANGVSAMNPWLEKLQLFENSSDLEEQKIGSRIVFWEMPGLMDGNASVNLERLVKGEKEPGNRLAETKCVWSYIWAFFSTFLCDAAESDEHRMHLVIYVQEAGAPAPENLLASLRKVTDPIDSKKKVTLLVVVTKMDMIKIREGTDEDKLAIREMDAVAKHLKSAIQADRAFAVSLYSRQTAFIEGRMRRVHSIDEKMCLIWKSILNEVYKCGPTISMGKL